MQDIRSVTTRRQHLLIDADDTLWHNNIYFEQAIEEFIDFLDHSSLSRTDVRHVLDEIQTLNLASGGYGSCAFASALRECYERLVEREIRDDDLATVMQLGERLLSHQMEPIEGVEATLRELATRHDLILFTKGQPDEQQVKIDRSGLGHYFCRQVIVAEKHVAAYLHLLGELASDPAHTWMVGNSPKSDINPALEAGLNAVYIPYEYTWGLEQRDLATGPGQLLVLDRFVDLRDHF